MSRILLSRLWNRAECVYARDGLGAGTEGTRKLGQGLHSIPKLPASLLPSAQGCMALAPRDSILRVLEEPLASRPSGSEPLSGLWFDKAYCFLSRPPMQPYWSQENGACGPALSRSLSNLPPSGLGDFSSQWVSRWRGADKTGALDSLPSSLLSFTLAQN